MAYTFSGSSRTPVGATTGYSTSDPVTGSISVNPLRDNLVVLLLLSSGATARTGGAPTFGTNTMIQANTSQGGLSSPEIRSEMWYITASGINQPTIIDTDVSVPNTGGQRICYDLISAYAGPGKTAYLQVATGSANATTSTNPYCSITPTGGSNIIFEVVANGANSWAPTARTGNFTNINDNDIGNYGGGMMYAITDRTTLTTGSWTFGTAEDWGIVMAAFGETNAPIYLQNSDHIVTSPEVTITFHEPTFSLVVDNTTHVVISDNVVVTYNEPTFSLSVDSSAHNTYSDNIVLTQNHLLEIQSSSHAHISDNVNLAQNYILTVENTIHVQISDNVVLTQNYLLEIQSTTHALLSGNIDLIQSGALTVQGTIHIQTSDNVSLTQHQILTNDNSSHVVTSGAIGLTQNYLLTQVNNSQHLLTSGDITLIQNYILVVMMATHIATSGNINLGAGASVPIKQIHYMRLRSG